MLSLIRMSMFAEIFFFFFSNFKFGERGGGGYGWFSGVFVNTNVGIRVKWL